MTKTTTILAFSVVLALVIGIVSSGPIVEAEPISEPVVEETPEPVVENQGVDSSDDEFSVQINEEFVKELTSILPFLVIVAVGIIVGIVIIIKNSNRNDDELSEDYEYDDREGFESGIKPIGQKYPQMQESSQSDSANDFEPYQIIENKLGIISKLQESKIGDNDKLEAIKKSLISDGSFTQEANDYLDEKYEEYKKKEKTDSEE